MSTHPELAFINSLGGSLRSKLSEPATPIAPGLLNLQASPTATIESLELQLNGVWTGSDFRDATEAEMDSVALKLPQVKFRSESPKVITHDAPNGQFFTVRELLAAVEATELQTRGDSEWFDGIDVHHVFFEGVHPEGDGTFRISWGS